MYLTTASEIKKKTYTWLSLNSIRLCFSRCIATKLLLNHVKFYLLETILTSSHGLMNQNSFAQTLQKISD